MIAGPTSFYIEPTRLAATSFFWTKAPYTTIVGDTTIDGFVDQLNGELDADKRDGARPPARRLPRRADVRPADDPRVVARGHRSRTW